MGRATLLSTSNGKWLQQGRGRRRRLDIATTPTLCNHHQRIFQWAKDKEKEKEKEKEEEEVGLMDSGAFYPPLLQHCRTVKDPSLARRLHAHMGHNVRLAQNTFLSNLLIRTYGACGLPRKARTVFDGILTPDSFSWNLMMDAYNGGGCPRDALCLYQRMLLEGLKLEKCGFLSALSAIATLGDLLEGLRVHQCILASGKLAHDVALQTALLHMFAKCGSLDHASKVFDGIEPLKRDLVCWNAMIKAYAQTGHSKGALHCFRRMLSEGMKPNKVTFLCLLDVFANPECLAGGKEIHAHVTKGYGEAALQCFPKMGLEVMNPNKGTFLSLQNASDSSACLANGKEVHGYAQTGQMGLEWMNPNEVGRKEIHAYTLNGRTQVALQYFRQMGLEGMNPNKGTFLCSLDMSDSPVCSADKREIKAEVEIEVSVSNSLLNMYSKCGSLNEARSVFNRMHRRSTASWNSMLSAYTRNGHSEEALGLFHWMGMEMKPDRVTFLCVLGTCASLASVKNGRVIHGLIVAGGGFKPDLAMETALLSMYAKCGSLQEARLLFDGMSSRDAIAWSSLLVGYVNSGHFREALDLFHPMLSEGVIPDKVTILCLLNACTNLYSLEYARMIRDYIIRSGLNSDITVKNALITMYGRCGNMNEAKHLFDGMHQRDAVTWNALLAAYVRNGHIREVLDLFRQMDLEGVKPDKITFLCLIDACASLGSVENGRVVHECIAANGLELDIAMRTSLLRMYGKCGCLMEARAIFDGTHQRDKIVWSAAVAMYAQNGHLSEAMELLRKMESEGSKPENGTLLCLLNACASYRCEENGRVIHDFIISSCGIEFDNVLKNALINMYGKCGNVTEAYCIYEGMHQRDIVTWNSMISALLENGHSEEALVLACKMELEGLRPNRLTFISLLNASGDSVSMDNGKTIHACIIASDTELDIVIKSALLNMYSRCGSLNSAQIIFDGMSQRDLISWNSMIAAFVRDGHAEEALVRFGEMGLEGVMPDKVTFLCLLNACANLKELESGRVFHEHILSIEELNQDVDVMNALISMYGKCGSLEEAQSIFDSLHIRNLQSWCSLLSVYAQYGHGREALEIFRRMDVEGLKPDKHTFITLVNISASLASLDNGRGIHKCLVDAGYESDMIVITALVEMYGKCGRLEEAQFLFDGFPQRNLMLWNALISAYVEHGHGNKALGFLHQMVLDGIKPNKFTFLSLLNACSHLTSLETVKRIHKHIIATGFESDIAVKTALLNTYGKCGSMEEAWTLFEGIQNQDTVSLSAMLTAYAQNGHIKEALLLFQQLDFKGTKPDKVLFLCLLNACNHAGLQEEGWRYFVSMAKNGYGITRTKDHYVCMLNLLGRGGCLEEAEDMAENMPMCSNSFEMAALLGACRIYHNSK